MGTIKMADIMGFLPLPDPPRGKRDYYVHCPQCDDPSKRNEKHLNINFVKNVFRCARCGWNGGIFDLYAFYSGIPRDKVRDELNRILRRDAPATLRNQSAKLFKPTQPAIEESPIAGIETRHAVYNSLLSVLSLAPDHKENLIGRGLPERIITAKDYKTTPMIGGPVIAKRLIESGLQLA